MIKLAILASGSGSNAEAIVNHFSHSSQIEVAMILSNKENAGVFERAKRLGIQSKFFTKEEMESGQLTLKNMETGEQQKVDLHQLIEQLK